MGVFQFADSSFVLTLNSYRKRDIFLAGTQLRVWNDFWSSVRVRPFHYDNSSLRLSTFELRWSVLAKRRRSPSHGRSEKRTGPKKNGDGGRVNAEEVSIPPLIEVGHVSLDGGRIWSHLVMQHMKLMQSIFSMMSGYYDLINWHTIMFKTNLTTVSYWIT